MKFYIYAFIVLMTAGFLPAGCARQNTDSTAASQNKAVVEEIKTGAPQSPPAATETNLTEISGDSAKAVTIYKSPTCGCCTKWGEQMTKAGFQVTSKPTENMAEIRKQYNVPDKMQSCHTAIVNGYVIEGHVPAADVKKLLETRPADIAGLAAPGMPAKSPGMQPEGEKPSGYDVLSFDRQGGSKVFASY